MWIKNTEFKDPGPRCTRVKMDAGPDECIFEYTPDYRWNHLAGGTGGDITEYEMPDAPIRTFETGNNKAYPLATGCLDYFPDALMAVANCSLVATDQHNNAEMHWDRSKSPDEANTLLRHFRLRGKLDTDGVRHSAKVAWRALALLQKEIEAAR